LQAPKFSFFSHFFFFFFSTQASTFTSFFSILECSTFDLVNNWSSFFYFPLKSLHTIQSNSLLFLFILSSFIRIIIFSPSTTGHYQHAITNWYLDQKRAWNYNFYTVTPIPLGNLRHNILFLDVDVKFCLKTKMLSNSNLIKNIKPYIYIYRERERGKWKKKKKGQRNPLGGGPQATTKGDASHPRFFWGGARGTPGSHPRVVRVPPLTYEVVECHPRKTWGG
jgi:hypothetical protein